MTGGRLKLLSLALIVLLAALVLLAWSQTWFSFWFVPEGDSQGTIDVGGDVVAAALPPLALASLAIVLALALAGPGFRIILGVLEALLGLCVALVSGIAMADPVAAGASAITEVTGVDGAESVAGLVESVTSTVWPALALAGGVLMGLVGIGIALTGGRWPVSGRKYSRSRLEAADGAASPVDEWDALSGGDDPTQPPR